MAASFPKKPKIIGLYGIPGSGKTTILNNLKPDLDDPNFLFYEGSEVIDQVTSGDRSAFEHAPASEKERCREQAITWIHDRCVQSGDKTAIVTGHAMFWSEGERGAPVSVVTAKDMEMYTHILYLNVSAEEVGERRKYDGRRERPELEVAQLQQWMDAEKALLRKECYDNGVLFCVVPQSQMSAEKMAERLYGFRYHDEASNLCRAKERLDEIMRGRPAQSETMLVFDGDKTLAAEDTGGLFWKRFAEGRESPFGENPLQAIFGSPMEYSSNAFRQASLLYEEATTEQEFDVLCDDVASSVTLYPGIQRLLQLAATNECVSAVVLTCGLRRVWEAVLQKAGLSEVVKVLGNGRHTGFAEDVVLTGATKWALVSWIKDKHQKYVWAFGDSRLDLDMLESADQAVVVVGEEQDRSRSMDEHLLARMTEHGLRARQVLPPCTVRPRLDDNILPTIEIDDRFVSRVLTRFDFFHATEKGAAKLLMSPTRNAAVQGPQLREAHRRVGWYLATEYLTETVGLEEYDMDHVQLGKTTQGHRLCNEKTTTIVALMRGGEPMAFGVSDALPLAMFVHANEPRDIKREHVEGQSTLVLVDSVINTGGSIVRFVRRIRELSPTINIVVLAGVVQRQSTAARGPLFQLAHEGARGKFSVVALRRSDNSFTGSGGTDTGNRLFNTTHMEKETTAVDHTPSSEGRALTVGEVMDIARLRCA